MTRLNQREGLRQDGKRLRPNKALGLNEDGMETLIGKPTRRSLSRGFVPCGSKTPCSSAGGPATCTEKFCWVSWSYEEKKKHGKLKKLPLQEASKATKQRLKLSLLVRKRT